MRVERPMSLRNRGEGRRLIHRQSNNDNGGNVLALGALVAAAAAAVYVETSKHRSRAGGRDTDRTTGGSMEGERLQSTWDLRRTRGGRVNEIGDRRKKDGGGTPIVGPIRRPRALVGGETRAAGSLSGVELSIVTLETMTECFETRHGMMLLLM